MEHVRIRACTADDIDRVIALERQWEQEEIAYGDFNAMSRDAYLSILEHFPAYFLVAENAYQEPRSLAAHAACRTATWPKRTECWTVMLTPPDRWSAARPSGRLCSV